MPILLFRVDERLIHGQVLIGWGSQLHPDRYVVVDDTLAGSDWEQELYRLGLPEGTEAIFSPVDEAASRLPEWKEDPARSIVLTRDVASMRRLGQEGALRNEEVNLGGLHHAPGRTEVLSYLHLSPEDRRDLLELRHQGAEVSARDLPGSSRVKLDALLKKMPESGPDEEEA